MPISVYVCIHPGIGHPKARGVKKDSIKKEEGTYYIEV